MVTSTGELVYIVISDLKHEVLYAMFEKVTVGDRGRGTKPVTLPSCLPHVDGLLFHPNLTYYQTYSLERSYLLEICVTSK